MAVHLKYLRPQRVSITRHGKPQSQRRSRRQWRFQDWLLTRPTPGVIPQSSRSPISHHWYLKSYRLQTYLTFLILHSQAPWHQNRSWLPPAYLRYTSCHIWISRLRLPLVWKSRNIFALFSRCHCSFHMQIISMPKSNPPATCPWNYTSMPPSRRVTSVPLSPHGLHISSWPYRRPWHYAA